MIVLVCFSAYVEVGEKENDSTKAIRLLSSARLMLKGVSIKIKASSTDFND